MVNQTAIKQKPHRKPEIDISGPKGNAYYLLGTARAFSKELGLDEEAIQEEMKSNDYENLITVFDKQFGEYVDPVRQEKLWTLFHKQ